MVHMAGRSKVEVENRDIKESDEWLSIFPPTPRRTYDGTVMLPESMQYGEADGIKHGVGGVEVVEQHDEEAVVGQLVELCGLGLVVLQEHMGNCH